MSLKKTLAKALAGVALVSSLYGLPTKKANALEMVYPSGLVMIYPEKNNKQTNLYKQSKASKQKQEKHYNWIRPDKYSKWQCAYELTYPRNDETKPPYGFMLYVDKNGDNKPDYKFKYLLSNVGHYYTGIDFDFKLDYYDSPVGNLSIEDNAQKALNTCGLSAIRQFIRYNTDNDNPADYLVDELDFENYHRIYASFYEK